MSSSDMMFVSDVYNNLGYLVPKNTPLETTTSLTNYVKASQRLGFTDYVNEIYVPYFSKANGVSREDIIAQSSLLSIKGLFPGRAMIYPYGGHCGNMEYKDNAAYMVNFFSGSNK